MALFSRRPKKPAESSSPSPEPSAPADEGAVDAPGPVEAEASGAAPMSGGASGHSAPESADHPAVSDATPDAAGPADARHADESAESGDIAGAATSAETDAATGAPPSGDSAEAAPSAEQGAAPGDSAGASADAETDAATGAPQSGDSSDAASSADAATSAETEAAASVSISVSSFTGLGSVPTGARPAAGEQGGDAADTSAPTARPRLGTREWMRTAPEPTETIPGLRDNVLLRAALGRVGDAPVSQSILDVARQLMQGHVFLRVKGDARALLAEGKGLPLAVATSGERSFALVYSSGAALQASLKADGDTDTSAMAQPVLTVLQHVITSTHDGIILDPASAPSRVVLPKELLQRAAEQADPKLAVKTLLAAERTPAVAAEVAEALTRAPLWVAVGSAEGGAPGLAEGRTADGARYLELYSHPLEVAVMGRGDNAAPITAAQLARALRTDEGITGVVVDPAGPWIRLTRDELAPVLSLAG